MIGAPESDCFHPDETRNRGVLRAMEEMTDYMKVSVIRSFQQGRDALARGMFMENEPGFAEKVERLYINQGRRMAGDDAARDAGFQF